MFIDLDRVPPEGQSIDRALVLEDSYVEHEEFRLTSPVALSGWIQPLSGEGDGDLRGDGYFRLRGRMSCELTLTCVRCLEPFPMKVAEELDLLYLPQSANVAPADAESAGEGLSERGLEREDLAVSFYRDDRVDLSQMAVEQIVLALPMKPLCKPDCRGLCARCGVNRNVESCDCAAEEGDPRWTPLKTLQKSRRS